MLLVIAREAPGYVIWNKNDGILYCCIVLYWREIRAGCFSCRDDAYMNMSSPQICGVRVMISYTVHKPRPTDVASPIALLYVHVFEA